MKGEKKSYPTIPPFQITFYHCFEIATPTLPDSVIAELGT